MTDQSIGRTTGSFNRVALVWGVLFVVIGGTFLLQEAGLWTVRAGVLLPALFVVAGAAMMLSAFGRREVDR